MDSAPEKLLSSVPPALQQTVSAYWEDWEVACEKAGIKTELMDLVETGKVWACSEYIARSCIRRPELLQQLAEEGFDTDRSAEKYAQLVTEAINDAEPGDDGLMRCLRQLRQQEMVRIAWRDLAGYVDVEQILHEVSDLAVAMVDRSLQHVYTEMTKSLGIPKNADGVPQQMVVLGMGKLGGRELNFSSDIDLIFFYPEEGNTEGGRHLSNHEFFVRLGRKLVQVLDQITEDGFVYRVDTRLRPNGDSGPLAMNFNAMELYYQLQGRDWERYAMIKARVISGRDEDARQLEAMLRPFTFRRYLDFGAFEAIREMKGMIEAEVRRKGLKDNIKLGSGGIREIEFIGQTFQLIRGGPVPELQIRGILSVLPLLAEYGHIEQAEADRLVESYLFLRKVENRLQMERDMQTHSLPKDELSQARITLGMGYDSWEELVEVLDQHRQAVSQVFSTVISTEEKADSGTLQSLQLFWANREDADGIAAWLEDAGCSHIEGVIDALGKFIGSARIRTQSGDNLRRIQQLLLKVLEKMAAYDDAVTLLNRVLEIVSAIVGRPVYLSLLLEYPSAMQQMLDLCAASQWFANELARYPILLDELLNSEELFRIDDRQQMAIELDRLMSHVDEDDLEQQMERLRQFRRTASFKLAATDVLHVHEIWDVGTKLSTIAEVVLDKVFELSWTAVCRRHGVPVCMIDDKEYHPGMCIIGYGKLGGLELGYGSDLDIVFLHDSSGTKQYTNGEKSIDNSQFFGRVAQKIIHLLGTRTHSGILYEADTRLRPDGRAGMMVSSVAAFEHYQLNKAWTWEHQALLRARPVSGSDPVRQEFARIRQSVLAVERDTAKICSDVVEMREKMREHLGSKDASSINFKQDPGGMVDIEFTAQAGMLLRAARYPDLLQVTSTLEFLELLSKIDESDAWFTPAEVDELSTAYKLFRQQTNKQALQVVLPEDIGEQLQPHRDRVTEIWNRLVVSRSQ